MTITKNFDMKKWLKESYYSSECLVMDEERISYISSRLKRKKICFYLKVWENISVRDNKSYKSKVIKIDDSVNLKTLISKVTEDYDNVFCNGGCVEIIAKNTDWCICHFESSGTFFCSRILEKLNIKIQETEEDARLSDEVPSWTENLLMAE